MSRAISIEVRVSLLASSSDDETMRPLDSRTALLTIEAQGEIEDSRKLAHDLVDAYVFGLGSRIPAHRPFQVVEARGGGSDA